MAMSNAERQRLYIQRLKARAGRAPAATESHPAAKPAKAVTNDSKLAAQLEPVIETLFLEGKKDLATFSPNTVRCCVFLIDRLLVEHGVLGEAKRSQSPYRYAAQQGAIRLAAKIRGDSSPPQRRRKGGPKDIPVTVGVKG